MSSLLPELKEVVHALDPIADKYFEVGVQLGLKVELIRRIEGEHPSHTRRLCEIIDWWQKNNSSECCTWSTLAEAVKRVKGYDNLACELRQRGNNAPVSRQPCGESEDSACAKVNFEFGARSDHANCSLASQPLHANWRNWLL